MISYHILPSPEDRVQEVQDQSSPRAVEIVDIAAGLR